MKTFPSVRLVQFTIFLLIISLLFGNHPLAAKPIGVPQAEQAVRGWLKQNSAPLGTALGQRIIKTDLFTDSAGEPLYYAVYLEPEGFVIVPAEDGVEPIIAFCAQGRYDPSPDNPLGDLISGDVPARI